MNYYPFHIGDYASATRHLSWDEDMAYRRLMDAYYTREEPIPVDRRAAYRLVSAATPEQREAVDIVLAEFFEETPNGWRNSRCDSVLATFHEKSEKAAQSANARWRNAKAKQSQSEGNANASEELCERMDESCEGNATKTNTKTNISIPHGIDKKGKRFDPLNIDLPAGISPATWGNWIAYRRERKLTIAETTIKAQVNKLMKWHNEGHDANAVIEQSIANGWQGLFEPKNQTTQPQRTMNNGRTDERLRVAEAIFGSPAPTTPRPINGTGNVIEATATRVISG